MSRLIDADSYLKNFCNKYCGVKECTRTQKKDCCIAISLDAEPTAYDVDKVVERLEEPTNYTIVKGKHFTTVERAIEIVKEEQ